MDRLSPFDTLAADQRPGQPLPVAQELAALYGPLAFPPHAGRPYVVGNFVTTLDGVVALGTPYSGGISTAGSNIVTGWYAPGSEVRLAKKTTGTPAAPVTCTSTSTQVNCSGNAYDRDGPLVNTLAQPVGLPFAPVLDGILYLQGDFDAEGNAIYFGSLLINGSVGKTGNARTVGCHLHFEMHVHGRPVDPEPALRRWDSFS